MAFMVHEVVRGPGICAVDPELDGVEEWLASHMTQAEAKKLAFYGGPEDIVARAKTLIGMGYGDFVAAARSFLAHREMAKRDMESRRKYFGYN